MDVVRRIRIKVLIERWDWESGTLRDAVPLDITKEIESYTFGKTLRNPKGSGSLVMLETDNDLSYMDELETMDVVKIYEFDVLKFIGYIQRVRFQGSIDESGEPNRRLTVDIGGMGGLFIEAKLGSQMGAVSGNYLALLEASRKLSKAVMDDMKGGLSPGEVIDTLVNKWVEAMRAIGGTHFATYLSRYVDYTTAVSHSVKYSTPKTHQAFTGTEESIDLWSVASRIVEQPLNELWFDNGPRTVSIGSGDMKLVEDKLYLVHRPTPYNGTSPSIGSATAFDDLSEIKVPQTHLLSVNLARTMDEVYSVYGVQPAAFNPTVRELVYLGYMSVSERNLNKYLFRPMTHNMFYVRSTANDDTKTDGDAHKIQSAGTQIDETLKAWFENNDQYLSGALRIMVPEDSSIDPTIGSKVSVEGVDGAFYVEGIGHQFFYGRSLMSDVTVSRGFDNGSPIKLKGKLFKRAVYGE